jgi:hypothetical protein
MPEVLSSFVGRTFGQWTVLAQTASPSGNAGRYWQCHCSCGVIRTVSGRELTRSRRPSRSCGCQAFQASRERKTHGQSTTRLYRTYISMLGRCYCPTVTHWSRYGGRGIKVHDAWLGPTGFEKFASDMGQPPSSRHTLDRENNDGDYSAENCRWATKIAQSNNRSNNRLITFAGRTQTVAEWCREFGLNRATVDKRLRVGKPLVEVFRPVVTRNS